MVRTLMTLSILAVSNPALALTCVAGWSRDIPASDSTGVPVNAILLTEAPDNGDTISLRIVDGEEVDLVLTEFGTTNRPVTLDPVADLLPDTTYEIVHSGGFNPRTIPFTTGAAPIDSAPPTTQGVLDVRRRNRSSIWGPTRGLQLTLPVPADEGVAWYEVEVTREDDRVVTFLSLGGSLLLGESACNNNLDDLASGEVLGLRARGIDEIGQASEWVIWDGPNRAPGCATGGTAPGWLFLPALLLAARRRR